MNYQRISNITIFCLLAIFLMSCEVKTSGESANTTISNKLPTPTNKDSIQIEVGTMTPLSKEESDKIDEAKRKELEAVPKYFRKVDFNNFKYSDVKLKDGEFVIDNHQQCDHQKHSLQNVYYADVNGDGQKEAIPRLSYVTCGCGSCSGTYYSFYFYELKRKKLNLIFSLDTGCQKYGCGLKTFQLEKNKLTIELYGDCRKSSTTDANKHLYMSGFSSKDITKKVYLFEKNKVREDSVELIKTEITHVMHAETKITINQTQMGEN